MHTGFWWGNMNERDHMKDLCIEGKTVLKFILKKQDGKTGRRRLYLSD
jgi:hypothetical protein